MKLSVSKSKNSESLYVTKSIYVRGKRTSKVVEKLGTVAELREKLNGQDPYVWAKAYIEELNEKEKQEQAPIEVSYHPTTRIPLDKRRHFNGGYLFLQAIYHEMGFHHICKTISQKHKFEFDLDAILSRLIYGRILFPVSKRSTFEQSESLLEQPKSKSHQIYRALEILAKHDDLIQAELYENSCRKMKRKTGVIYYDCTNYFFEIEQEDAFRKYGASKEHRPNPIVQMGLMMDAEGIPLAFCMNKGNTNEQVTLQPLEEKILKDYSMSKFIVCTDAGLSSAANKKFNSVKDRAYITTQSIKQMPEAHRQWALEPCGWRIANSIKQYRNLTFCSPCDIL